MSIAKPGGREKVNNNDMTAEEYLNTFRFKVGKRRISSSLDNAIFSEEELIEFAEAYFKSKEQCVHDYTIYDRNFVRNETIYRIYQCNKCKGEVAVKSDLN